MLFLPSTGRISSFTPFMLCRVLWDGRQVARGFRIRCPLRSASAPDGMTASEIRRGKVSQSFEGPESKFCFDLLTSLLTTRHTSRRFHAPCVITPHIDTLSRIVSLCRECSEFSLRIPIPREARIGNQKTGLGRALIAYELLSEVTTDKSTLLRLLYSVQY